MVEDRTKRILNDFKISPLSTTSITFGYTISAAFASVLMSIIILFIGEGYMLVTYGEIAAAGNVIYVFCMIILIVGRLEIFALLIAVAGLKFKRKKSNW